MLSAVSSDSERDRPPEAEAADRWPGYQPRRADRPSNAVQDFRRAARNLTGSEHDQAGELAATTLAQLARTSRAILWWRAVRVMVQAIMRHLAGGLTARLVPRRPPPQTAELPRPSSRAA
jgi:hypothetical protein